MNWKGVKRGGGMNRRETDGAADTEHVSEPDDWVRGRESMEE